MRTIDRRLAILIPGFSARRECWQAIRYPKGGKFDYHLDAGFFGHEPEGERVRTALIYLDTPRRGGSTRFKHLHIDLKALAGRLVVWKNVKADAVSDPEMLHSGVPVLSGRKTILVTHIRQRKQRKERS